MIFPVFWPSRISFLSFFELASKAILNGLPFSMIRLGDGEGAIMAMGDESMQKHVDACFACWFGNQIIGESDRLIIKQFLMDSILGSDVIGLPRYAQLDKTIRYAKVFEYFPPAEKCISPLFVDSALHFYLQWSRALSLLMRMASRIIVIGPRDIAGKLASVTNVPIVQWLVKGEAAFPGIVTQHHWRKRYDEVINLIDLHAGPRDLVLVGAGLLGKSYVSAARTKGCVGLDIGSVIDGWDNVLSRNGRITDSPVFGIDYLAQELSYNEDPVRSMHNIMKNLIESVPFSSIPDPTV